MILSSPAPAVRAVLHVDIEHALEQPRPEDAARSALVLSRLGLACAGHCGFGGLLCHLGPFRHHQRTQLGIGAWVRVAYAGSNDQPYRSVGRWLIEQGELKPDEASWPAIRAWAARHPKRVDEMLRANPRFIFFREEALPAPALGPRGAQGVPLTPGRSIAVDPRSIPYGTPVWLAATEPLSNRPLQRLVLAQDTGSAITGAVRADYFWGRGDEAEQQAGPSVSAIYGNAFSRRGKLLAAPGLPR